MGIKIGVRGWVALGKDKELFLNIDDDFKSVQSFDVNNDYPDTFTDLTNEIRMSVSDEDGTIAYMECTIFNDYTIAEGGHDYVLLADSMVQDAYDAMFLLHKCSLIPPSSDNQTIGEVLTSYPTVTVYLRYITVKDNYRKQGIGNWLIRNLSRIIQRNYSVFPRVIITLIAPQEIKWAKKLSMPIFDNLSRESAAYEGMYKTMSRLFEGNGYEQYEDTDYYIKRDNI